MAVTLPTSPPVSAIAGDTWTWTDESADYPASAGWVVAYRIAGPDVLTWNAGWAVAAADTTTVTIPATSTANLRAGAYRVTATYTLAGVRHSVPLGTMTVEANPDTLAAGDTVGWAERTLAAIEGFLEGHLEGGVQYYMIGTRQVGSIPLPELYAMRSKLRAEVAAKRRGAAGLLGPTIAWHYRRPVSAGDDL
jgi:hypothetical protein